jgi:hypothetical protein
MMGKEGVKRNGIKRANKGIGTNYRDPLPSSPDLQSPQRFRTHRHPPKLNLHPQRRHSSS